MCVSTYVDIYICYVSVVDVSRLSGVRVADGVAQWNILSNLPGECYGSYSLLLSVCSIRSFTILPILILSDDVKDAIDTGEAAVLYLISCGDTALFGVLGVTPEAPPTTNLTQSTTPEESVVIGACILGTLSPSITPVGMQPLSGQLELLSSINNVASTTCNITLNSEVAIAVTITFNCNQAGKCWQLYWLLIYQGR